MKKQSLQDHVNLDIRIWKIYNARTKHPHYVYV